MSRYIDAELIDFSRLNNGFDRARAKIIIMGQPTADVVEVRHGEWIDKPTGAYSRMQSWCSACGKHSGIGGIESNRHKPYCPNCGAKIGERSEQNEG